VFSADFQSYPAHTSSRRVRHMSVARSAILLRCTREEAELIRKIARNERRTVSGFPLYQYGPANVLANGLRRVRWGLHVQPCCIDVVEVPHRPVESGGKLVSHIGYACKMNNTP